MRKTIVKHLYLIFILLQIGCGNKTELKEEIPKFALNRFPIEELSFDKVSASIFEKSCTQCHPGYSDYQTVKKDAQKILEQVLTDRMPKNSPGLDEDLKSLLNAWVSAGAPLGGGDTDNEEDNELKPTWDSLSRKVFFPKCVSCHNANGQANFLELDDRQDFFDNRDYLLNNFEDVENSYLIEVISDPDEPMPPFWSPFTQLNETEIATIKEWIEKGLP
tara:strand:- start:12230 stop:12886 length:657 start_codon:yes stop_codon:yes gene_type:complete